MSIFKLRTDQEAKETALRFVVKYAQVCKGWVVRISKGERPGFETAYAEDAAALLEILRQQTLGHFGEEFHELETLSESMDTATHRKPRPLSSAVRDKMSRQMARRVLGCLFFEVESYSKLGPAILCERHFDSYVESLSTPRVEYRLVSGNGVKCVRCGQ